MYPMQCNSMTTAKRIQKKTPLANHLSIRVPIQFSHIQIINHVSNYRKRCTSEICHLHIIITEKICKISWTYIS